MNLKPNSETSSSNDEVINSMTTNRSCSQQKSANQNRHNDKPSTQPDNNGKPSSHGQSLTGIDIGSALLSSTDYKNTGNRLCSLSRYEEAINYYVKAIEKSPDVAIYYSNKALCHLKLQDWNSAIQDCRYALELDPSLIKAHYFIGQALAEIGSYDESLKHLQRAHELAKEGKLNFGDDIACQIRLVKRRRWNKIEDEQTKLEDELHKYLVNLIKKDEERLLGEPTTSVDNASQQEVVERKCDTYIDKLDSIFNNLKIQRKRRDVPDYLCGKISFEIMQDPVITPCGITYDRHDIEEHLRKVGHFDPITRQPLTFDQLIPNLTMKDVIDAYLSENEWAHYY